MEIIRRSLVLGPVLALLVTAPALAWGPLDGSYAVTETLPGGVPLSYYVVVIQNGGQIGAASLFPQPVGGGPPTWTYAFGEQNPEGFFVGYLYWVDGSIYGSFAARFLGDGTVIAAAAYPDGSVNTIQSVRFF